MQYAKILGDPLMPKVPQPNSAHGDSWYEYQRLVLSELDRLNTVTGNTNTVVVEMSKEIAMLKVKSGLWGAAAGVLPVAVLLIVQYLMKG